MLRGCIEGKKTLIFMFVHIFFYGFCFVLKVLKRRKASESLVFPEGINAEDISFICSCHKEQLVQPNNP